MKCRSCNSDDLEPFLNLGYQPWANGFLTEDMFASECKYPLRVVYCHQCSLVQLDHTVKKEIMFGDHTYLSGVTKSLSEHFRRTAETVHQTFLRKKTAPKVLDIGSNDGTQLQHYKSLGCGVLGVESSVRTAQIAVANGIPTLNKFFNAETANEIGEKFDVINASGVFFHLEELHSVCEGIRHSLAAEGVFVVQFLYMKDICDNLSFDQIYHEHLLYYTLKSLKKLLSMHELELFDAYHSSIHGGSIIAHVSHVGAYAQTARLADLVHQEEASGANSLSYYQNFANRVEKTKDENIGHFSSMRKEGKKIFGLGAPVKGNTLLNYYGFDRSTIEYLVEKNPLRKGLFAPGSHIPVVIEPEFSEVPDVYYVLAWNFKKEILANYANLICQGVEFYFPVNMKD